MSIKRIEIILAILALLLFLVSGTRTKRMYAMCPPKFIKIENECYYISREKLSWLESHFACKDKNSKLAEPMKFEDRALRKFLLQNDKDETQKWIGGVYNWEKNKWQWGQTGRDIIYQSFSQMDPRSSLDLRYHCSVLNPNIKYRWSARNCVDKHAFVCQHRMPYVNENNRQKIYTKWNETYPNQMANEIEVLMDESVLPRNNYRRKANSIQTTKRPIGGYRDHHYLNTNQVSQNNIDKPRKRLNKEKRKRMKRPHVENRIQELQNDAAFNSTGNVMQMETSNNGLPIIEIPDNYDLIKTHLPPQPTQPKPTTPKTITKPTSPIKRRRKDKRRKPVSTQNNANEVSEKKQFDNIETRRIDDERILKEKLLRDEEAKRMKAEREMLEENARKLQQERQKQEERRRIDEAHRKVIEERMAKEQQLLIQKEEHDRRIKEVRLAEENRKQEEQKRKDERLRIEQELEQKERENIEKQRIEKQAREENRLKEEQRRREEELRKEEERQLKEQQQHEEYERRLEEERRLEQEQINEERRIFAERRENERKENEERLAQEKREKEKREKIEKLRDRLKKLTPEQRAIFLSKKRQRDQEKNESIIPQE